MMNIKRTLKIMIIGICMMLGCVVFRTNITQAYEMDDVKIVNDLANNTLKLEKIDKTSFESIDFLCTPQKMNELLNNKSLLSKKAKNGKVVYEYAMIKIEDEIDSAKIRENIKNNMIRTAEIIKNDDGKFVKIPIEMFINENNEFYPVMCDQFFIELYSGSTKKNEVRIVRFIQSNEEGATIELKSTTNNNYDNGGSSDIYGGIYYYDRIAAEGDCSIVASSTKYVGESLEVKNYGTLKFEEKKTDEYGETWYIYSSVIKDKTIFNNDKIRFYILSNEMCTDSIWEFTGEKIQNIKKKDTKTNILLNATTAELPKNVELNIEKVDKNEEFDSIFGKKNNYVIYDISLLKENQKIQPNGKIKISIPIPEDFTEKNILVYRLNGNEKIKYNVTMETISNIKYATIETDHFSYYAILDEIQTEDSSENENNTEENNNEQETKDNTNNESTELDDTPKTGNVNKYFGVIVATSIAIICVIILRKRIKK